MVGVYLGGERPCIGDETPGVVLLAGYWATLERCQGIEDLERAEPSWNTAIHDWSRRGAIGLHADGRTRRPAQGLHGDLCFTRRGVGGETGFKGHRLLLQRG